uniref:Small ribosomal subunit protein bS6m n=1 Tax=Arion vulgaris TaxID=1028688 RepID=A0A0B6Y7K6_9EUPU
MPTYEMSLILKALQRPELVQVIKRSCTHILEKGGIIRGMENLGLKPLPHRKKAHGERHCEGNYVLIRFDGNTLLPSQLNDVLRRDTDVIMKTVFLDEVFTPPCTVKACEFGEIKNPDHEKRLWWSRVNRRYVRMERRKAEKKA